jgi:hypothetical protein
VKVKHFQPCLTAKMRTVRRRRSPKRIKRRKEGRTPATTIDLSATAITV